MADIRFMRSLFLFFQFAGLLSVTLLFTFFYPSEVRAENSALNGSASYYSNALHGRKTASGEIYNKNALTAAHRSYPFGTCLKVTNIKNGNSVIVKVNDRGPNCHARLIDVSYAAAIALEMVSDGVIQVCVEEMATPIPESESLFKRQPSELSEDYYTEELKPIRRPKGYLLQVGIFSLIENAQTRITELKPLEPGMVYIQVIILQHKKLYRVLCGAFITEEELSNKRAELYQAGYESILLPEDNN